MWKVHWEILEVQKPQEYYFVWQLNAAFFLWYPFSQAGLSGGEAASFHWSLSFRGTKVRNEDSVSCWAPFAECSESSVLSEHAHTRTEYLCWIKGTIFKYFPHYCVSSISKHSIKTPLFPDTCLQWVLLELRAILDFLAEGCCCLLEETVLC